MSIWLPEKGFDKFLYKPSNYVYIQSGVSDNGTYCYCGLEKADPAPDSCYFSGDKLYKDSVLVVHVNSCYTSSAAPKSLTTLMVWEISSYLNNKLKTPFHF